MRAILCDKYGTPEHLKLRDVPRPKPKADQILVRVKAVSVNSWDCEILKGLPIVRITSPIRPSIRILGADIAGIVEAVGSDVAQFKVGDAVFGDLSNSGWGGMAEYAAGKAEHFAHKPEDLSFEAAACLPQAGLLALQAIEDMGALKPGEKMLFNGAGGGAGMFALQMAKQIGAETFAVDHKAKFEAMHMFGADHVIDYQTDDFTTLEEKFDLIIDAVATRPMAHYRRALTPNGRFVMMGGKIRAILGTLLASRREHPNAQQFKILAWQVNSDELTKLAQMIVQNKLQVFIDKIYSLEQAAEAIAVVYDGKAKGKIVISI